VSDYATFVARKHLRAAHVGFAPVDLHPSLFPHQRDTVDFLCRIGRGAAFLDTGLGKTFVQLEWARQVVRHSNGRVLVLTPLAVAAQTVREGEHFGIDAAQVHDRDPETPIVVCNYERMDVIDPTAFVGAVLDESSILKSFNGATRTRLIDTFRSAPFRLACTATPAPNDHMEIGNHAEFLGVMRSAEMLSRFFINDTATASQEWRIKRHAVDAFWAWVASWSRCVAMPSDLGHQDDGFALPPLDEIRHVVATDADPSGDGMLFRVADLSATGLHREKRRTVSARADHVAALVASDPAEPWIVWCDSNDEADALLVRIPDAVEVRGNMTADEKERRLLAFSDGAVRVLVTKPSIAGFGLNWQHCARVAFVGLSYSYEAYYQAVRRCWRFGQSRPVQVHQVMADSEVPILDAINAKAGAHVEMKDRMRAAMRRAQVPVASLTAYNPQVPMRLPRFMEHVA
jgi:hypothetical protein